MKNIKIILVLSLFMSCNQEKLEVLNEQIFGREVFDPSMMEIDSSLLNNPKFIRYMDAEGSGSLSISMSCRSEFHKTITPLFYITAVDNSARDYNLTVSSRKIDETNEVILPPTEKIESDCYKYKLRSEQVHGKLIIVRGEKNLTSLKSLKSAHIVRRK